MISKDQQTLTFFAIFLLIFLDTFLAARREFHRAGAAAVAWPFATIAAAMLVRGVIIAMQPSGTPLAHPNASVDTLISLWAYTFLMLLLNISLFGSVLARLVMKIRRYAERDFLTGLLNRRAFETRLALERKRHERSGKTFCVIVFDIDHFKAINDQYGHGVGDRALRHVSELLQKTLRQIDAIARFGGEEFLVLLPDTEPDIAADVAERLRLTLVANPLRIHNQDVRVQASFGYVSSQIGDDERLISLADKAMYCAKAEGRNRVCAAET